MDPNSDGVMLIGVLFIVLLLTFFVLIYFTSRPNKRRNATVMIITGSGGHTAEILHLVSSLNYRYSPRVYVVANTDATSEKKIIATEKERQLTGKDDSYHILKIPRSREVHQSWITTVFTTLLSTLYSIPLVLKWRPDIILCNGPGTCVPVCLIGVIAKTLRITRTKAIYIESICRVYDLSLSGKILYYFVDYLFVQWPELCPKYPAALYIGRIS